MFKNIFCDFTTLRELSKQQLERRQQQRQNKHTYLVKK